MGSAPMAARSFPVEARMAFIRTVDESEAVGEVKAHYDAQTERAEGVGNIHKIYSIKPSLLQAYYSFSRAVTFGATSLGRRREEMLAVAISSMLKCKY